MEATMGKRIVQNRKAKGLTQDALAEQLGITAQAVSKWENDLSCPDIAMLPRLAEIFGISTDELLGQPQKAKVYDAEVVNEEPASQNGVHVHNGNWEFHWDSGRRTGLTFAFFVLWVGVLTLVARVMEWDVSFWSILWPSALLIYGFVGIFPRFSVFNLCVALFGGYHLVSNLGLWQIEIADKLIFPICVVLFGLSLFVDAMRKPKKPKFRVAQHGKNGKKTSWDCNITQDSFECSLSFGENRYRVDVPVLAAGKADCSFGELIVDLSGCEAVSEDCRMEVNCSFGEVLLLVPGRFAVQSDNHTSFASVNYQGHTDNIVEGVIKLDASVSFGEINVRYI